MTRHHEWLEVLKKNVKQALCNFENKRSLRKAEVGKAYYLQLNEQEFKIL